MLRTYRLTSFYREILTSWRQLTLLMFEMFLLWTLLAFCCLGPGQASLAEEVNLADLVDRITRMETDLAGMREEIVIRDELLADMKKAMETKDERLAVLEAAKETSKVEMKTEDQPWAFYCAWQD